MDKKRVYFLDEVRGFAILCMVVYHLMFDLRYFFHFDIPIFFDGWFDIIRDIFAGTFIFISGAVCRFSSSNYKRGVQCFFIGMIMTFVTAFVTPEAPIYFGILHMLGISMLIFALLEDFIDFLPSVIMFFIFIALFIFTLNLPHGYVSFFGLLKIDLPYSIYNAKLLFPLGFKAASFQSTDYFPLFPWLFLFLGGSCFGVAVKNNNAPSFFYRSHARWLGAVGRYTIWIYVLHQPIIYCTLNLIFNGRIF